MIHSTIHRKVLSLTIHIADFDWIPVLVLLCTHENIELVLPQKTILILHNQFSFFTGVDLHIPSSHCLMIITCMWSWIRTQSKCCHNKMLHLQSNPVFLLSYNIITYLFNCYFNYCERVESFITHCFCCFI